MSEEKSFVEVIKNKMFPSSHLHYFEDLINLLENEK